MFLSIIIPVYKVDKYIRDTFESIYQQEADEHEFEVICVNDNTPDNSMQIVKEFAVKHNNLHIVNHEENQGLSCARNSGLRYANGDYIWFVDSDDKITRESIDQLEKIVSKDLDIDIWGFDLLKIQEDSKIESIEQIVLQENNNCLYGCCVNVNQLIHKIHVAPVQRFVFKKAFLDKCKLKFYPKILHEDKEFMVRALFLAEKIMLVNYVPYSYLVRASGSIMSSIDMRSVYSKMTIIDSFQSFKCNYAKTIRSEMYFRDNMFLQVLDILTVKIASCEYQRVIKENSHTFRKIALNGLWSNIYYRDLRKVIKAIVVLTSPSLFTRLK